MARKRPGKMPTPFQETRDDHLSRWIVMAVAGCVAAVFAAFVYLRDFITRRPPRPLARRADDALYHATPAAGVTSSPAPEILLAPEPDQSTMAAVPPANDSATVSYVEGNGEHEAPAEYPVKVNQRSGIYHLPGDLAYDRTVASRFYRSAEAAEADGFRHALR